MLPIGVGLLRTSDEVGFVLAHFERRLGMERNILPG